ncbi:amyloid-beta-like protein isoform X2 [Eurytemora carolleeae]|uniref:amyloid-beta-like protein isoform X2 n=1 Tax=Eurytemora carolleeae TaxID=1294199 RepID=UPI000C7666C3|nr:amyloid-beta-like protein isoform X2 [Eurytemora carolleeae]|eukprot:XP_023345974.1 amyloid-beta-like protein isoform X2 [Eurytemora affinis]
MRDFLLFGLVWGISVVSGTIEFQDGGEHFEPTVAMYCPEKGEDSGDLFYNKYLAESGVWMTDTDSKATCVKDKVQILEYCKKVYPERDITNIVEGAHYMKLGSWCRVGGERCVGNSHWVRPYRCLEGPFQSDALLVPEQCQFDHIHNQSRCWSFSDWNSTAVIACNSRQMIIRSFAILLPCGIDLFSGVEFVCCPTSVKQLIEAGFGEGDIHDNDQDNDYYADEEDTYYNDSDYKEETTTSTTTTTTTSDPATTEPTATTTVEKQAQDPYLTHYMPQSEHTDFIQAEIRFDQHHRERVEKLMKDWGAIQDQYKQDKDKDPETVKQELTQQYQENLKELEEQHQAERRQLVAMHQQRVIARFGERKDKALICYKEALDQTPFNVHRIKKCLQKVLKSLHKERNHAILQFRRLVDEGGVEIAKKEIATTIQQLKDIDTSIEDNLNMLSKSDDLKEKILPVMTEYLSALRAKDSTPYSNLIMNTDAEKQILLNILQEKDNKGIEEKVAEKEEEDEEKEEFEEKEEKEEDEETTLTNIEKETTVHPLMESVGEIQVEVHATAIHEQPQPQIRIEESLKTGLGGFESFPGSFLSEPSIEERPAMSHNQAHFISHSASYTMKHTRKTDHNSLYVVSMLGVGIMVVVVFGIILRRRGSENSSHDGFIQVDTEGSPEEYAVSSMQMTGYENPTYKYFETST